VPTPSEVVLAVRVFHRQIGLDRLQAALPTSAHREALFSCG